MKELIKPLVWKEGDDDIIARPAAGIRYTIQPNEDSYVIIYPIGVASVQSPEAGRVLAELFHEGFVRSLLKTVKPIVWTHTDTTSGQADVANPMVEMYNGYTPVEMFTIEVYEEGPILLYDSTEEAFVESVEHGKELATKWHLSRLISCFE